MFVQACCLLLNFIIILSLSNLALASNLVNELSPCVDKRHCAFVELKVDDFHKSFKNTENIVQQLPRTEIVNISNLYLHAESGTRWMHFIDDVEIKGIPEHNSIQIRSESRIGVSDFGLNQRRVDHFVELIEN